MHTNAYLFSEWKKECIILDPGADAELIISRISVINMKPRGILCTHGHIDHISAAGLLKQYYQALGIDLPIAIHEEDSRFFGKRAAARHRKSFGEGGESGNDEYDRLINELPDADVLLKDGDSIFGSDLRAIHTPGHTAGSVCVYSETQGFVFSGDTLLFEGIGRTDIPGSDRKRLVESIRTKILVLPSETRIFPGHGPFTDLEREIKNNPHLN